MKIKFLYLKFQNVSTSRPYESMTGKGQFSLQPQRKAMPKNV